VNVSILKLTQRAEQNAAGNEFLARARCRAGARFLERCADVVGHERVNGLTLGSTDTVVLPPAQRLAYSACKIAMQFPVMGEARIRAGLQDAADLLWSAADLTVKRKIQTGRALPLPPIRKLEALPEIRGASEFYDRWRRVSGSDDD